MLAVIALFVALAIDLPDLNETGLIGRTYDQAEARPRVGFFVETLGATLALLGVGRGAAARCGSSAKAPGARRWARR